MYYRIYLLFLLSFGICIAQPQNTQNYPQTKVSALAFMDYGYMLDNSDVAKEGQHGFAVRRLFLTTDFVLSEKISARARLETNTNAVNSAGLATPWMKDLSLTWKDALGKGHNLVFGIFAPPVYNISEEMWAYRSLAATMLDANKIVTSRDFGVAVNGKVTSDGKVKYAVMYANNNAEKGETDLYKRGYAQLHIMPNKKLNITLDADYAGYSGGVRGTNLYAFAGYKLPEITIGVEANRNTFSAASVAHPNEKGISAYTHIRLQPKYELVARLDKLKYDETKINRTFFLTGVSYSPIPSLQITPNVVLSKDVIANNNEDRNTQIRLTMYFKI